MTRRARDLLQEIGSEARHLAVQIDTLVDLVFYDDAGPSVDQEEIAYRLERCAASIRWLRSQEAWLHTQAKAILDQVDTKMQLSIIEEKT